MQRTIRFALALLLVFYMVLLFRHALSAGPRGGSHMMMPLLPDSRNQWNTPSIKAHVRTAAEYLASNDRSEQDDSEDTSAEDSTSNAPVSNDGTSQSSGELLRRAWRDIQQASKEDELDEIKMQLDEINERFRHRARKRHQMDFDNEKELRQEQDRRWARRAWESTGSSPDVRGRAGLRSPVGEECPGLVPSHSFAPYSSYYQSDSYQPDYAYVTLVTSPEFVQAAAVLMFSIATSGTQYSRAICVTKQISAEDRRKLALLGQIIEIEKISSPLYIGNERYRDVFTKLRIWQLTMYTKVLYIDTDVVVLRNMDVLFDLPQWGVPMDADADRYSTGMMVIEPSLDTFDEMMESLAKTSVSMELPDLLFLKDFFDHRETEIVLIPRWYQVYQNEFGSEYHSYLTNRKQNLNIFDERIHGIHYPGEAKPWKNFREKFKTYQRRLCDWFDAQEFQYQPNFIWYVNHAQMKLALSSIAGVTFDYEFAPQIVLSKFVSEGSFRRSSSWRDSLSHFSNSRTSRKPKVKWPYSPREPRATTDSEVWVPSADCRFSVPYPIFNPLGTVAHTVNITHSKTEALSDDVTLGVIDFTHLDPFAFSLPGPDEVPEVWVLGWCSQHSLAPVVPETEPCTQSGYFMQYTSGSCRSAFSENLSISVLYHANEDGSIPCDGSNNEHLNVPECKDVVSGVVFRAKASIMPYEVPTWVEVAVRCDPFLPPNTMELERGVEGAELVGSSDLRLYRLALRSRCACLNGCGVPSGEMAPLWRDAKFEEWQAQFGGHSYADQCAKKANASECDAAVPSCAYHPRSKLCSPPLDKAWVLAWSESDSRAVTNCTFLGGSDKVTKPKFDQCVAEAESSGANVINYRGKNLWNLFGTCFYHKCPRQSLLQAGISVEYDYQGYEIWMLNPFASKKRSSKSAAAAPDGA